MVKFIEKINSKKIRILVDGLEVEIFEQTTPEEIIQAVGKDPIGYNLVQKTSSKGCLLLPKKTTIIFREGDYFSTDPCNLVN